MTNIDTKWLKVIRNIFRNPKVIFTWPKRIPISVTLCFAFGNIVELRGKAVLLPYLMVIV